MVAQVFIGSRVYRWSSPMEARQDDGFLLAVEVGRRVLTSARCRGRRPCALAAAGLGNDATFPSSGPVPVPLLRKENVRGRCRGGANNCSHFASGKDVSVRVGAKGGAAKTMALRCLYATLAKSKPRPFLAFFDLCALQSIGCKPAT